MSTWLPFCIRRDGPAWKHGYPDVPSRSLEDIEGEIDHSMEGYWAGARSVLHGTASTSWTFSVFQNDPPEQHYPLEAITWHAGVKGDGRRDTSLIGNLVLVGIEHEGIGEPLTQSQLEWSLRISKALWDLCPNLKSPALRVNLWEHNWVTATSCPSGRIPWQAKLDMEGEMDQREFNEMFKVAWETLEVTRDTRPPPDKKQVLVELKTTPARITDSCYGHKESPHGGGEVPTHDHGIPATRTGKA